MAKSSANEPVTIRIGGEDHTIRANVKPEYTRRCAKLVDDRISEIRSQLGLIESHKAAILAALSITDELFQARSEADDLRESAGARIEELALGLEKALVEDVEPPVDVDPPVEQVPPVEEVPPVSEEPQLALDEPREAAGEAAVEEEESEIEGGEVEGV